MRKYILSLLVAALTAGSALATEQFVVRAKEGTKVYPLIENGVPASVISDTGDKGVVRAVRDLRLDFERVSGQLPVEGQKYAVIVGTLGQSANIDKLVAGGHIAAGDLQGRREKYIIQTVDNPLPGVEKGVVIAGSDKRGTIYGVYELSRQMGVSPWYWWADVPSDRHPELYAKPGSYTDGEPAVRYRGIFINDESPGFKGWSVEKFGGVNSKVYEHMFELILRLKGNFLWPAMWGNAIYHDDPASGGLANDMGIVLGTSHHEPMGRAHEEWVYYGKGEWNYEKNPAVLREYWKGGMERMKDFETVVTVGMRGDGDEPMSEGANINLLQRIIKDQRDIISKVTGRKAEERPQAWALYKEVQDYYDKGMRVPDDITLLLCDDNWGNVRKLPDINAPRRKGGYGMYYHFDYVGGPRNYKWINVSQIQRVWEQMNLTYTHGVDRIWVVNVGDLKPMEFPISFFLDFAWAPERFNAGNLMRYTEDWCAEQFGEKYAAEAARMLNLYTKYNSRVTPELLDANTFSMTNYDEFATAVDDYKNLALAALRMYNELPHEYRDAFDELVLYPINASCNLYEMYYAVAMNRRYAAVYDVRANEYARIAKECFARDSSLTVHYNKDIAAGKWAHQMDQVRIGYTSWNDPPVNIMPALEYVYKQVPAEKRFIESDGYISMEACHYARAKGSDRISWIRVPELGKTKGSVTTFPQNVYPKDNEDIYVEYDLQTLSDGGTVEVELRLAPTLNFNANKGLRYALSFDGGKEETVNFNGHYDGSLGAWQGERIIISKTKMTMGGKGDHRLRIRVLEPGIVIEKVLIDMGGLKPSYLGAPESAYVNNNSPFPPTPPAQPTSRLDNGQMAEQLGIAFPTLMPKADDYARQYSARLRSAGSGVELQPQNTGNTDANWAWKAGESSVGYKGGSIARSSFGLWTNYVEAWEPGGDYLSGAKFYKPLELHNLAGLSAADWKDRRAKIFDEVQKIYGYVPASAKDLAVEWTVSKPELVKEVMSFNRKATPTTPFRQYVITGRVDTKSYPELRDAPVISGILRVPAGVPEGTPAPVVINYTWTYGRFFIPDEALWNTMAANGIAVLYYNPVQLQPDNGQSLTSHLIGLAGRGQWRKPYDWGTLVAWSWGVSRLIDMFEKDGTIIDASKVAVSGHSRYGKGALVAMAYDTRIAAAYPSSSGAMGAAPSRRHWGEDLEICAEQTEYHWIAGDAMRYQGIDPSSTDGYMPRKVINMPVDAESLVALCAPRPVFIGSGEVSQGDAWADPYGMYLTAVAASPVYELLGGKGLVMDDKMDYKGRKIPMPVTDKAYLSGDIGFRRHHGGHEAAPNYPAFRDFLLKYWK
jgi:hypothetical protein